MDIRTLFRVAIKLIGVYFLFGSSLNVILQSTITLSQNYSDSFDYAFQAKLYSIFGLIFWILMPLFLIFKTDGIIGALDLLKGFGESITIPIDDLIIMKAGLIFIGGFCIIDHLPTVITASIMFVKQTASGRATDLENFLGGGNINHRLILEVTSLILGITILTNYDRLARFFLPKPDEASL